MLVTTLNIYVQSQFVAFHRWEAAPSEVDFLRTWHRHIFKTRVDLSVTHHDRHLEFFMVQRSLNTVLKQWEGQQVDKSCEMFCEAIALALMPEYPTLSRVEVSEDGENGAVLSRYASSTGPTPASLPKSHTQP